MEIRLLFGAFCAFLKRAVVSARCLGGAAFSVRIEPVAGPDFTITEGIRAAIGGVLGWMFSAELACALYVNNGGAGFDCDIDALARWRSSAEITSDDAAARERGASLPARIKRTQSRGSASSASRKSPASR